MIKLDTFRYALSSYSKFLWRSTNAHGIHSPFVYDLVTKCFYDQSNYPQYSTLRELRKELRQSHETIQVLDFGAGSRDQNLQKGQTRPVKQMLHNASISPKRQRLLFRLVHYFNSKNVLELGTHLGMGTIAMALGNPKATITTVEGCPNTEKFSKNHLNKWLAENHFSGALDLINTPFTTYFAKQLSTTTNEKKFNLIYLDGHHDGQATLEYFNKIKKLMHNDSLLIIDDIYWSKSMTLAWNDIVKDPKVTVSIDTYFWGLIFFRKEQTKEHFIVRI